MSSNQYEEQYEGAGETSQSSCFGVSRAPMGGGASTMAAVGGSTVASTMTAVGGTPSGATTMTPVGGAPMGGGQSTMTTVGGASMEGGASTLTAVAGTPTRGRGGALAQSVLATLMSDAKKRRQLLAPQTPEKVSDFSIFE